MPKAVIIGGSSGIGRALAILLSDNGYELGIVGRRFTLLQELQAQLPTRSLIKALDVRQPETRDQLKALIDELGQVDLVIISAGIGYVDPELSWEKEKETIETNVLGFGAAINLFFHHFSKQKHGHIVALSSIAAIKGGPAAPSYHASKAYMSNYLEGLSIKANKEKLGITITDLQPGFVDTAMAQGVGLFWVASPEKAAAQIFDAIKRKKRRAYITKRWGLIAAVLKVMPGWVYRRIV